MGQIKIQKLKTWLYVYKRIVEPLENIRKELIYRLEYILLPSDFEYHIHYDYIKYFNYIVTQSNKFIDIYLSLNEKKEI